MEDNDLTQSISHLCRNGCGFYASSNSQGFCSKCHRDMQATAEPIKSVKDLSSVEKILSDDTLKSVNSSGKIDEVTPCFKGVVDSCGPARLFDQSPSFPSDSPNLLPNEFSEDSRDSLHSDSASISEDLDGLKSPSSSSLEELPKRHVRCFKCKKRVGLNGFTCRCPGIFCSLHRYSDAHDCQFDYRESGQADIRKANPMVVCSKIDKI